MPPKLSTSDDDTRLSQAIRDEMAKRRYGLIVIAKTVYNQLAYQYPNVQPKDCEKDLIDALELSRPFAGIMKATQVPIDPATRRSYSESIARAMLDDPQDWSDICT
jgi:hypothetical protein